MCIDPLAEKYAYQSPYNFSENKVISFVELEGLEGVPTSQLQQWNGAFKEMVQTFAGTFDNIGAEVKAFFTVSRDVAPSTKVETTTSATVGTNLLNYINAKQFDQNTKVNPFTAKIETKVEVKVAVAEVKAKVEAVDVSTKVTNITNVATGNNKTEVKTVVGSGQNGVYVTTSTDSKTSKTTTRAGVQLQAETPKVQGATFKVGLSASIGQ